MKKRQAFYLILAAFGGAALSLAGYIAFIQEAPATIILPSAEQPISFSKYEPQQPQDGDTRPLNFRLAAQKVTPTVVHIRTYYKQDYRSRHGDEWDELFRYFGVPPQDRGEQDEEEYGNMGSGSGVIISADGYIVTNNHVIENADKIEVILSNKRKFEATVIGTDITTDLGLVKIEAKDLKFITYGNSDNLQIGDWVLAVGNPFNLTSTVTAGIVSAKGRNINLLQGRGGNYTIESFIQTDAAVNPGNSGGALVNTKGELIGINTAIASRTGSYAGYSFAVPINLVQKVITDLKEFGTVQRGLLGVSIRDIDADNLEDLGLKKIEGIYVVAVNPGSGADDAGMEEGDVILSVDGKQVNSVAELQELVGRHRPGHKINVTVKRGKQTKKMQIVLKNKNNSLAVIKSDDKIYVEALNADVVLLDAEERRRLDLDNGVKIVNIKAGVLKNYVQTGFIITRIDKEEITSVDNLKATLAAKAGEHILIEGVYPNGTRAIYGLKL